ncbi:IS30 family transposase [Falsihalocynthiibacter arcticus]|uniref:Transposase n=1 Tax=Falsihalocynthiibacter arcticus TaxID=1579316 RepID=A0A126V320_9RHOB|nr:IS30 family transposase [Falsihalocynthiibacter arcticus]AML52345.1 transposase [Falsihalocynthiibacter arcticus]AML52683.1 transposase [Falsihalocynthiibacter arcticus]
MGTTYTQLSITERRRIERWKHTKVPVDEMARVLKRCRSTIYRELRRNHFSDESLPKYAGYYGEAAHTKTADRRARQRKLIKHPSLCDSVIRQLKNGWTPEQIGNRMILEKAPLRVCQETIYRYIYSKDGMNQELWWYLPTHRMSRKPRRARKRQPPKFHRDVSILFRPDDVAHRRQFGHWEADLMLFKQTLGQTNVTTLVERVSRFTLILKNPNRRTKPVMGKIMKAIKDLPHVARRSITFDRGTEFVSWPHLQAEIGTLTWFCDPSSPWQKGTVENTNRRARRWLPRKRDIRRLTDHDIKEISDRLNSTPRKCLGWKTPAEVFREKMLEEMR